MTSIRTTAATLGRAARLTVALFVVTTVGAVAPGGLVVPVQAAATAPQDYMTDGIIARDAFGTDSSTGPVTAEIGGRYAVAHPAGTSLRVMGGGVTVTGLEGGQTVRLGLPATSASDVQVRHALEVPVVDAQPLGLYESADVRLQADGDRYSVTAVAGAAGDVALKASRVRGGSEVPLGRVAVSTRLRAGQPFYLESRVVGTSPVTLLGRVWARGAAVPAWQQLATDSSAQAITAPGAVALRAYASTSAPGRPFTLADLTAWTVRPPTGTTAGAHTLAPTGAAAPAASSPLTTSVVSASTSTSAAGFVHPGVVDSAAQLSWVKQQIAKGAQPWASAFAKAKGSRYASLSWTPHPVASVGCGSGSSPDQGCTAEMDDAQAAYTDALLWSYTGDAAYARKSIQIMNAWSAVLKQHKFDTTTYVNGRLQAAWVAEVFTKAAEIIRYSPSGWGATEITRFQTMLKTAFLPMVREGWTGGGANWQLSMAEATINIGVFTDDRAVYDDGVSDWRRQVKAAIYLHTDGAAPVVPAGTTITPSGMKAYWYNPSRYVDGLEQESCRDNNHMAMGLGAALNAAETARIQGTDLFGEEKARLVAALEYNTRFLNNPAASGSVCSAQKKAPGAMATLAWEIGYAHYAGRLGMSLPQTRAFALAHRPTATAKHLNWLTLTHAG